MAGFSVSEAAFTGFRVVWERPWAAAIWAAVFVATSLGLTLFMTMTCGAAFGQMLDLEFSGRLLTTSPLKLQALSDQLAPFDALLVLIAIVFYPVFYAAMNRAVLRPGEAVFGYLRLGGDELRQLGLMVLFVGLWIAGAVALTLVATVLFALAALIGSQSQVAAAILLAVIVVGLFVGGVGGVILVATRLSLASAITFATKRISLLSSWKVTRGHFWPIFGAYLIAFAMAVVVWLLVLAVSTAAAMVAGGGDTSAMTLTSSDLSSPAAYFSPARATYMAFSAVSSALIWPLLLTPAATIYRRLAPDHGLPTGPDGSLTDVFA